MARKLTLKLIAACDKNLGIGLSGSIPWSLSADLRHFKRMTSGSSVIMGKRTWDSLPFAPLPGRTNIVLTRQMTEGSMQVLPKLIIAGSLSSAIAAAPSETDVWVIGGANVYSQAINLCHSLYITEIDAIFNCDTFMPEYRKRTLVSASDWQEDAGVRFRFTVWE